MRIVQDTGASPRPELVSTPSARLVSTMSDYGALAAQTNENSQREDAHPLDQAAAYQEPRHADQRIERRRAFHMSIIATVAARLGREPSFRYDRIRLLDLISPAQDLFRSGEIYVPARDRARAVFGTISGERSRRRCALHREHVLDFDPRRRMARKAASGRTRTRS